MIIHCKENDEYFFERETPLEWICFEKSNRYNLDIPTPVGYFKTHEIFVRDCSVYWLFPFYYLVKIYLRLGDFYWRTAHYCKCKGWIKKKQGERYKRFWFLDLIFKK